MLAETGGTAAADRERPKPERGLANPSRVRASWLLAHLPFVLLLILLTPIIWPHEGEGDTFFFWYAGHLVATGMSPYDQSAWGSAGEFGSLANNVVSMCTPTVHEPTCLWKYPPTTALIFAPFALLSVREGLNALAMFVFATSVASIVALGQWMRAGSQWTRALLLGACVLSHPFVFEVYSSHFEGLGVLGVISLAVGLRTRRVAPVVLGALLMSLKPHLYAGLAVVALVVLLSRRDWRTLGWTAGAVGVTYGVALLRYPEAVGALLAGAGPIIGLGWATTWAFGSSLFPSAIVGIAIVYAIAAAGFATAMRFAPAERRDDVLVAAGAAIGTAISPYVHPYDMLVLLPGFALTLALGELASRPARGVLIITTAGTLVLGTWLAIAGTGLMPVLPGVLPVVVLVLLAVTARLARTHSPAPAWQP